MSQPDLLRELRAAKPIAPGELRERIRLVAANDQRPPERPRRRRRALFVAAPVVAAAIVAAVVIPRGPHRETVVHGAAPPLVASKAPDVLTPLTSAQSGAARRSAPALPSPSGNRLQRYSASLELRVKDSTAISDASKSVVAIARSLGGYPQTVNVVAETTTGYANLTLRIPKTHVSEAVRRLSALGRILSESVSVQDLQTAVNATSREIARLQRRLAALRAETAATPAEQRLRARQIAAVTAHIETLQRGQAATRRTAHFATVNLQLTTKQPVTQTPRKAGPLHGIGVAFRWAGIGAVYALAFGTPLALVAGAVWLGMRTLRRRREERLLGRA